MSSLVIEFNMLFIIIITLYVNFATGSDYKIEYIWLNDDLELKQENLVYPVLLEGSPLNISIIVHNSIFIRYVRCRQRMVCGKELGELLLINEESARPKLFTFTVHNLKLFYGNQWKCVFSSTKIHPSPFNLKFHVRYKLPFARMFVNDYEVKSATTSLAITAYDAIAHYMFTEDETAIIDCSPRKQIDDFCDVNNPTSARKTPTCKLHFRSDLGSWRGFYLLLIKLTKEYETEYVECMCSDGTGDHYVTRLIFKLKTPDIPQSIMTLKVNGVNVNVLRTNFGYTILYHAGEPIELAVAIQNINDSSLVVRYDKNERLFDNYYNTTLNLKEENDGKEIKIFALDSKFTTENLTLTFIHNPSDLFLTDINKGNILKEYTVSERSSVVYYLYSDNEKISIIYSVYLEIHCSANGSTFNFDANHLKDSRFPEGRKISVTLDPENNGSIIHCFIYRKGQKEKLKQIYVTLLYKPSSIIMEDENASSWIPWTISLLMLLVITVIIILAVIMKKRKKKQSSVTSNVNLPVEFADMYPMEGPDEEPVARRTQLTLPHTPQEPHHHCAAINDTTMYSEMYYEPSFPTRKTPTYTENEYAYVDCAHLLERHKSPFDAVATKIALEQAKKSNKVEYSNLQEVCRPGHCVLRDH